uniref:molybdopterin biosynthesis protein n=1 Tax=Rhodospora sordida TaxID=362230 RepID=UPI001FCD4288|nr:molybdopterin biosynthesis protein [Rhodospora sordida]UNJ15014.1 molybdopterin biosynthesis protein [Rhodospora sordida]
MLNSNLNDIELSLNEYKRYSRQLLLTKVQIEGQKRLYEARIACVGVGALGSSIITYLAAAGVRQITIIDHDIVDISNLQRQPIHNMSFLNFPKTDSASNYIQKLNPNCRIDSLQLELNQSNIYNIIYSHDIILDGTDNISTRYLIDEFCSLLSKPWIYGGVFQFEGQVSVFNYRGGSNYRDLYPKQLPNQYALSCSEGGILGVVPGLIGLIQATEALKIILGIGDILSNKILIVNTLTLEFRKLRIRQNMDSHSQDLLMQVISQENFADKNTESIDISNLNNFLIENSAQLIDVRSEVEFSIEHIPGALNYPLNILSQNTDLKSFFKLPQTIVIYCSLDSRSHLAYNILKTKNLKCKKLKHGLQAWKRHMSTTI